MVALGVMAAYITDIDINLAMLYRIKQGQMVVLVNTLIL